MIGDFTILIRIPFASVTPFISSHGMSYSSYFLFVYLSVGFLTHCYLYIYVRQQIATKAFNKMAFLLNCNIFCHAFA